MKHPKYLNLFSQKAFAFTMLFALMFIAGASESAPPMDAGVATRVEGPELPESVEPLPLHPRSMDEPAPVDEPVANPWKDYPNQCDRPRIVIPKGNKREHYRKIRYHGKITKNQQKRHRAIAMTVAEEMGANPTLIDIWMTRESSRNPHAIHILNPDLEANSGAHRRFSWSEHHQERLERILASAPQRGEGSKAYYAAKAELGRRSIYRNNPFWRTRLELPVYIEATDKTIPDAMSVWAFGYGLYGMNAVLFTDNWDRQAPPWILCGDEGIIATVVQVWASRKAQVQCEALGIGGTYEDVNRRMASGHCKERTTKKGLFLKRADQHGLDVYEYVIKAGTKSWAERDSNGKRIFKLDAEGNRIPRRAQLGSKWKRDDHTRVEVLEHMRQVIVDECLTEETWMTVECRNPKAKGYSKKAHKANNAIPSVAMLSAP